MDTFLFFPGHWLISNPDWDHWLLLEESLEERLTAEETTE